MRLSHGIFSRCLQTYIIIEQPLICKAVDENGIQHILVCVGDRKMPASMVSNFEFAIYKTIKTPLIDLLLRCLLAIL